MTDKNLDNNAASKPDETKEIRKPAAASKVLKHKRTKVTKLNLKQVNDALTSAGEKMGGNQARHVQALLARKAFLMKVEANRTVPIRKAA